MHIEIDRLREIGWTLWDPIGLLREHADWRTRSFKDEYDSYLKRAVRRIVAGENEGAVTAYLIGSASHRMGLGEGRTIIRTSTATARALIGLVEEHRKTKS